MTKKRLYNGPFTTPGLDPPSLYSVALNGMRVISGIILSEEAVKWISRKGLLCCKTHMRHL